MRAPYFRFPLITTYCGEPIQKEIIFVDVSHSRSYHRLDAESGHSWRKNRQTQLQSLLTKAAHTYYPIGGLGLVLLIVLLVVFLRFGRDRVARPARMIRQFLRRSASSIAIFIKTSSVGRTQSIGIALHCSVGQMMRSGPFPRLPPITWICRPVIILPQTRQ